MYRVVLVVVVVLQSIVSGQDNCWSGFWSVERVCFGSLGFCLHSDRERQQLEHGHFCENIVFRIKCHMNVNAQSFGDLRRARAGVPGSLSRRRKLARRVFLILDAVGFPVSC